MAFITATCETDGRVELKSRDVYVRTYVDDKNVPTHSNYCFKCPLCKELQVKPADLNTVAILKATGCREKIDTPGARKTPIEKDPLSFDQLESAVLPTRNGESKLVDEINNYLAEHALTGSNSGTSATADRTEARRNIPTKVLGFARGLRRGH